MAQVSVALCEEEGPDGLIDDSPKSVVLCHFLGQPQCNHTLINGVYIILVVGGNGEEKKRNKARLSPDIPLQGYYLPSCLHTLQVWFHLKSSFK